MVRHLTPLQIAILKNAPGRNAAVEKAVLKSTDALIAALEAVGAQLKPGSTEALHKILRVALNLSRAKGRYEGLRDGYRLHELGLQIEGDPTTRTILRRIHKFKKGDDKISDEELCIYLDGEIQRRDKRNEQGQPLPQPFPPSDWKISENNFNPWMFALKGRPKQRPDKKLQQRVSTYFSRKRKTAWGKDYSFIVAWEELARSVGKDRRDRDISRLAKN